MQLRIIDDIVQTVGTVHRLCRVIARHDPDLSRQMKRAINSVGLNSGEADRARRQSHRPHRERHDQRA